MLFCNLYHSLPTNQKQSYSRRPNFKTMYRTNYAKTIGS